MIKIKYEFSPSFTNLTFDFEQIGPTAKAQEKTGFF